MCDNSEQAKKEKQQDTLVQWYFNDYIPNCLKQHTCQMCESSKKYDEISTEKQLQFCVHYFYYKQKSIKNLKIYKYLPKGLIEYDCDMCEDELRRFCAKWNIKIQWELSLCAYRLYNHVQTQDCLFGHMNQLIFRYFIKLNQLTQNKIIQVIKFWKNKQQQDMQDILLLEKYFFSYLQVFNNIEQEVNNLKIASDYQKIIQVDNDPEGSIQYASLSQKYLVYVIYRTLLYIYDIESNITLEIKYFSQQIAQCQFTDDEKYLFVSLQEGFVMRFCVRSNFKKTKRWFFHQNLRQTIINIKNLNYYQIFVAIEQEGRYWEGKYDNIFIQFDLRQSKQIAKFIGLSKYTSNFCQYHKTSNCILHVNLKILEIFSLVSRIIIKSINMNNVRYMELMGCNRIICLDNDTSQSLRILTFNFQNQSLESQFVQEQVMNCYCNKFQEYSYNQIDNSKKWNVVSIKYGQLYQIEQSNKYEFNQYNLCNDDVFIINNELGIGVLSLCYK